MPTTMELETLISKAFADRELLKGAETQQAVNEVIAKLDKGELRVAEKQGGAWVVNAWVKEAILLYFAIRPLEAMEVGALRFYDKIPTKGNLEEQGIRIVPPGVARLRMVVKDSTGELRDFQTPQFEV